MPALGDRGHVGYTFDAIELSSRADTKRMFELRSKCGGVDLGTVHWSHKDLAYVYTPSADLAKVKYVLTENDLRALHAFVQVRNMIHQARQSQPKTT